jgi:nicotinamide riboside kinase
MITKVVNLFGGPGCGKSTLATGLHSRLSLVKQETGITSEYVAEYAKDVTWRRIQALFDDQLYVFAKQHHRLVSLLDKVNIISTDAPLLNSLIYVNEKYPSFKSLVFEAFHSMNNINYYLRRVKEYDPNGRNQTEAEAREYDIKIRKLLDDNQIEYKEVVGNSEGLEVIVNDILKNNS